MRPELDQRIFVAGHRGMVGSAIMRRLGLQGYRNIITASRDQLDLVNQRAVHEFFKDSQFDQVYLAAAKVGGIHANDTYPADFIYENLMIEANILHAAHLSGVKRLLFLGSSCIYPKDAAQPMKEGALLTGALEPTNEPYAIAKIAGIKLCESYNRQFGCDFRSVMPTNLYGPNDNFHKENSHVIPALFRRFHEAAQGARDEVLVWGTGSPRREFLHVNDMADACIYIMQLDGAYYRQHTWSTLSHINVGTGVDCTIRELAEAIANITGFRGRICWDSTKPDGTARKLLDVSRLAALGWQAAIGLDQGLRDTYTWFVQNQNGYRA